MVNRRVLDTKKGINIVETDDPRCCVCKKDSSIVDSMYIGLGDNRLYCRDCVMAGYGEYFNYELGSVPVGNNLKVVKKV